MKFRFDKDVMVKQIATAQEVIANKSPIAILSNVLLVAKDDTLTIKATDNNMNFTVAIPVEVEEEGSTTVFCDKFMSILLNLPQGDVEFIQDEITVMIKPISKKIRFQLKTITSEKFPDIPNPDLQYFNISAKDFKSMVDNTIFAASTDPHRYFMTGVFFTKVDNKLVMVSTNARRLAIAQTDFLQDASFSNAIVPVKILKCVIKKLSDNGDISIAISDRMIFIKFNNYLFSSKLIDGQFPEYDKVIPQNQPYSLIVNKQDLEEAMKRNETMVEKDLKRVIFNITSDILKVSTPETDLGKAEEEMPCKYVGKEFSIAFEHSFILDPLRAMKAKQVKFEFADSMGAVKMMGLGDEDFLHILMPIPLPN